MCLACLKASLQAREPRRRHAWAGSVLLLLLLEKRTTSSTPKFCPCPSFAATAPAGAFLGHKQRRTYDVPTPPARVSTRQPNAFQRHCISAIFNEIITRAHAHGLLLDASLPPSLLLPQPQAVHPQATAMAMPSFRGRWSLWSCPKPPFVTPTPPPRPPISFLDFSCRPPSRHEGLPAPEWQRRQREEGEQQQQQ